MVVEHGRDAHIRILVDDGRSLEVARDVGGLHRRGDARDLRGADGDRCQFGRAERLGEVRDHLPRHRRPDDLDLGPRVMEQPALHQEGAQIAVVVEMVMGDEHRLDALDRQVRTGQLPQHAVGGVDEVDVLADDDGARGLRPLEAHRRTAARAERHEFHALGGRVAARRCRRQQGRERDHRGADQRPRSASRRVDHHLVGHGRGSSQVAAVNRRSAASKLQGARGRAAPRCARHAPPRASADGPPSRS